MQTTATSTEAIATTILEQLELAWNAGDGAAFGAPFADESDFVNVRGEHHRGADNIAHGHQAIFDSIYAGSTVRFRLDMARPVAGTILAVATSTLDAPSGPLQGIHNARFTMVIAEQGDDWRVASFHNTLVAEGR
jgi:uncharacterized protein (TIGR02246 family)